MIDAPGYFLFFPFISFHHFRYASLSTYPFIMNLKYDLCCFMILTENVNILFPLRKSA